MIPINLRNVCLKILEELETNKLFINDALEGYFNMLTLAQQEKAFINRVVYGTVEYEMKIDYIINQYSKVKASKLKKPILLILRMSIYQMLYMEHIPHSATIDEAVKLVKKRKMINLAGFVNGVLRNISRNIASISYPNEDLNKSEYLSIMYSFPKWLVDYLLVQYDYMTVKEMFEDSLKTPKLCIRHNALKGSREELLRNLKEDQLDVLEGHFLPYAYYLENAGALRGLKAFQKGLFQVQDESSMLVGEVANPKEQDLVLDVCSAPGGKTTHMAQIMNNKGLIYARDVSERKLEMIKENCSRLGISNVDISKQDATVFNESFENKIDIVVTDVPCSGLGIIKKKPDIKYNVSLEGISSLIQVQKEILSTASKYVKIGGFLIYSTCTINKWENDKNIEWFLENNTNFDLIPIDNDAINKFNTAKDKEFLQLLPTNKGSDGFFIAKMKRMA
ncbi:MAG: 16S rRNA (cytosine(967)-C(5))-methyltransferase [Firmicutes bacterium HGW-Firmicutes-7]|nr:MAG: 16S rRNA (cytosine(967)-C(5))-methyltransferase [Firmicutes bacterium HGW-Firmicutes-7]